MAYKWNPFIQNLDDGGGGSSTSPASPNQAIQFNNGGIFGGSGNLVWDNTNKILNVRGPLLRSELSLDPVTNIYSIGDITGGLGKGNALVINNDALGDFIVFQGSSGRRFLYDGLTALYQFGDVDGTFNGSLIAVDDAQQIVMVNRNFTVDRHSAFGTGLDQFGTVGIFPIVNNTGTTITTDTNIFGVASFISIDTAIPYTSIAFGGAFRTDVPTTSTQDFTGSTMTGVTGTAAYGSNDAIGVGPVLRASEFNANNNNTGNVFQLLGSSGNAVNNVAGNVDTGIGLWGTVQNIAGGSFTSFAVGTIGEVDNYGSGSIGVAVGVAGLLANTGAGTISTGSSLLAQTPDIVVGSVNFLFGLDIKDHSGIGTIKSYNIYSEGSASINWLEGTLTMGSGGTEFTIPNTDGTSGQVLITNGTGVLAWGNIANGGDFINVRTAQSGGIILPNSPTYTNVSVPPSGVGATIDATVNGFIGNIGGISSLNLNNGDRLLIWQEQTGGGLGALANGVYVIVDKGSAISLYHLIRALDSDQPTEFDEQVVVPTAGTFQDTLFEQITANPSIGVDPIVYNQLTSFFVKQSASGTQTDFNIPTWTSSAKSLRKGTTDFQYNTTAGITEFHVGFSGSKNLNIDRFNSLYQIGAINNDNKIYLSIDDASKTVGFGDLTDSGASTKLILDETNRRTKIFEDFTVLHQTGTRRFIFTDFVATGEYYFGNIDSGGGDIQTYIKVQSRGATQLDLFSNNTSQLTVGDAFTQRNTGVIDASVITVGYGSTTTITANDGSYDIQITTGTGATTVNLPTGTNSPVGTVYIISDLDAISPANNITVDAGGGNTINDATVAQTYVIATAGESITLKKVTSTAWKKE